MSDPAAARAPGDNERRASVRASRELFPPRQPLPLAARRAGVVLIADDFTMPASCTPHSCRTRASASSRRAMVWPQST